MNARKVSLLLLVLSGFGGGCGSSGDAFTVADMQGSYLLQTMLCHIGDEFIPGPVLVRIESEPPSGAADGCEAALSIEFQTCPDGCGPTICELCVTDIEQDEQVEGTLVATYTFPGACSAIDYRGGVSEDLFFSANQATGSIRFHPDSKTFAADFSSEGESYVGIGGTGHPATLTCELVGYPAE